MSRNTTHRASAPDDETRVARFTRALLLAGLILIVAGVLHAARYLFATV